MKDLCKSIRWGFGLTLGYYMVEGVNNMIAMVFEIGRLLTQ